MLFMSYWFVNLCKSCVEKKCLDAAPGRENFTKKGVEEKRRKGSVVCVLLPNSPEMVKWVEILYRWPI